MVIMDWKKRCIDLVGRVTVLERTELVDEMTLRSVRDQPGFMEHLRLRAVRALAASLIEHSLVDCKEAEEGGDRHPMHKIFRFRINALPPDWKQGFEDVQGEPTLRAAISYALDEIEFEHERREFLEACLKHGVLNLPRRWEGFSFYLEHKKH